MPAAPAAAAAAGLGWSAVPPPDNYRKGFAPRPRHRSWRLRATRTGRLKRMTRLKLIEERPPRPNWRRPRPKWPWTLFYGVIAEALRSNERVDYEAFGSFVVKERKERQGRNPRTGETITIAAKRDASFRPSKELEEEAGPERDRSDAGWGRMMPSERSGRPRNAKRTPEP